MARTEDTALSALLSALGKGVMQLPVEMEKQKEVQRQNALTSYQMMQQQEQQRQQQESNSLQNELTKLKMRELNEQIRRAAMEPYMTEEQKLALKQKYNLEQIREREGAQLEYSERINKDTYGGYTGDAKNVYVNAGGGAAGHQAVAQYLAYQRQMKENVAGAGPQLQSAQDQFLLGHGYAGGSAGEKLLQDQATEQRKKNDDWNPFNNSDTTDVVSPVALLKQLGQVSVNVPSLSQPQAQPIMTNQPQSDLTTWAQQTIRGWDSLDQPTKDRIIAKRKKELGLQ